MTQDLEIIRHTADIYRKMALQFEAYHPSLTQKIYDELTKTRGNGLLALSYFGQRIPYKASIQTPLNIPQDTNVASESETNILLRLDGSNDYERLTNLMKRLQMLADKLTSLCRPNLGNSVHAFVLAMITSVGNAFSLCWELQQEIKRRETDLRHSC